jgi:hypothetical protein
MALMQTLGRALCAHAPPAQRAPGAAAATRPAAPQAHASRSRRAVTVTAAAGRKRTGGAQARAPRCRAAPPARLRAARQPLTHTARSAQPPSDAPKPKGFGAEPKAAAAPAPADSSAAASSSAGGYWTALAVTQADLEARLAARCGAVVSIARLTRVLRHTRRRSRSSL